MGNRSVSYIDLADYCQRNPHIKEQFIAASLRIDPARFSKLKSRKYGLRPTGAEGAAIAKLLRQSPSYVTNLYENAA